MLVLLPAEFFDFFDFFDLFDLFARQRYASHPSSTP
jgi:hypothetical protein